MKTFFPPGLRIQIGLKNTDRFNDIASLLDKQAIKAKKKEREEAGEQDVDEKKIKIYFSQYFSKNRNSEDKIRALSAFHSLLRSTLKSPLTLRHRIDVLEQFLEIFEARLKYFAIDDIEGVSRRTSNLLKTVFTASCEVDDDKLAQSRKQLLGYLAEKGEYSEYDFAKKYAFIPVNRAKMLVRELSKIDPKSAAELGLS